MPRSEFPADMQLEVGMIIGFSTPSGEEVPGAIQEIKDDEIVVDFNHPLAGHEVIFDVEILEVKPGVSIIGEDTPNKA
jgi:FKBP-type peptidyl-prolyl cis-trans isomerase SlpA